MYAATASPKSASLWFSVTVSFEQTGVSSDGTALSRRGLAGRSARVTGTIPASGEKLWTTKSRAGSPACGGSPTRCIGLPKRRISAIAESVERKRTNVSSY